jgi:hypothetical protein
MSAPLSTALEVAEGGVKLYIKPYYSAAGASAVAAAASPAATEVGNSLTCTSEVRAAPASS